MFSPNKKLAATAYIKSQKEYDKLYKQSIRNPKAFWAKQAEANISWFKKWNKVLEYDFAGIGTKAKPYVKFFAGAKLNVSYNCLDRHVNSWRKHKAAIIWQGEQEHETRTLTYQQLLVAVSKFANVLQQKGVKQGDVVTLYLPMVPEAIIAMLACARIGAIHSVVFSAFSANALKQRILDCNSKIVITANFSFHGDKIINLKNKVDTALTECPRVKTVIVCERTPKTTNMQTGRDYWWHEAMQAKDITAKCEPTPLDAEDPLFILYTSGSTGQPKGIFHTCGGYLLYTHLTAKFIFDLKDTDIHWCTADVGWITGHSYTVYGPLSNGATILLFEGIPTHPEPDRFWQIIEQYQVTTFYTAPTAIRALMRLGTKWPEKHDLSSLRILGSVGEPINHEAWIWYYTVIGQERCPVLDTWWQTETGGIMIAPLPGAIPTKPGSASKPFFGIEPEVLTINGRRAKVNEDGVLVIKKPWPSMFRGIYGDKIHKRAHDVYFSAFPGKYFTGDACKIDADGFYWLMGRIDDVINVSGHRLATAEIENAIDAHEEVAEAATIGYPHEIKGEGIYCFVTLKPQYKPSEKLKKILIEHVTKDIGPIAKPDIIQFCDVLPKTRSGKIMRRILRKIAAGQFAEIGDTTTLADPDVVTTLIADHKKLTNKTK